MSMCYWGIVGYGVCIDDIYKYIDHGKVNKIIRTLFKEDDFYTDDDVFDDDTFYGNPYCNFAEFLCELDEDKIFNFDDDGQGKAFFLYEPNYPWHTLKNEDPKTIEECEDKMIAVLRKVCDAKDEDLRNCINYISESGCS